MVTLLNSPILTSYGIFSHYPVDVHMVKDLISNGFVSAIGHQSTAEIISSIIGVNVPMNRIQYEQKVGDVAIIFKLNSRPPEGKILTKEEIEAIGYSFSVITMSEAF